MNVEIIDFSIPTCNRKNLFVTNIPPVYENVVYELLFETFSKYGLLHEVQIFPSHGSGNHKTKIPPGFYAFVKFYSFRSAATARQKLNGKMSIGDNICKVAFAKRRKGDNQVSTLPLPKCYELANYYLGFNGWSCKLQMLEEDNNCERPDGDIQKVRFFCKLLLDLTNQNLSCNGVGVWEESFVKNDLSAKCVVMAKVQKMAHKRALENAFSKLLIISLANGKVAVEVNTTLTDEIQLDNDVDENDLLKVNELAEEPEEEEVDASADLDDVNLQILRELEDQS